MFARVVCCSEGGRAACVQCMAGYACPTIYSNYIIVCPRGTYTEDGATYCTECEAGFECENTTNLGKPSTYPP